MIMAGLTGTKDQSKAEIIHYWFCRLGYKDIQSYSPWVLGGGEVRLAYMYCDKVV